MKTLSKTFLKGIVFGFGFILFLMIACFVFYKTPFFDEIKGFYESMNKNYQMLDEIEVKIESFEIDMSNLSQTFNSIDGNKDLVNGRVNIETGTGNSLSTEEIILKKGNYLVYFYKCMLESSSEDYIQFIADSREGNIESFFTNVAYEDMKDTAQIPFIVRVLDDEANVSFKVWNPNADFETLTNPNDSEGVCESFYYVQIN